MVATGLGLAVRRSELPSATIALAVGGVGSAPSRSTSVWVHDRRALCGRPPSRCRPLLPQPPLPISQSATASSSRPIPFELRLHTNTPSAVVDQLTRPPPVRGHQLKYAQLLRVEATRLLLIKLRASAIMLLQRVSWFARTHRYACSTDHPVVSSSQFNWCKV